MAATKKIVIRNGIKLVQAPGSGAGDDVLTRDSTSGDVGKVAPVDVSVYLTTSLNSGQLLVGNNLNIATARTISGAISISNTGVSAISNDYITNAHVNSGAGIVYSKLNLTNSINDSDIAAAAGITRTKIANGTANRILINNGTGVFSESSAINPNVVLVSNGSGIPTHSGVSTTTLSYLDATSPIQGQLDNKPNVSLTSVGDGDLLYYSGGVFVNLGIGAIGEVLTVSGSNVPEWSAGIAAGLPSGGTTNQYLKKNSNTNYDAGWDTLTASDITDITASAAELNILDGATLSTAELNFVDGVTSNIQSQLDGKQSNLLAHNAIWVGNISGNATQLSAGSNGTFLGIVGGSPTWTSVSGGHVIQTNSTPLTQRANLNFSTKFTVTDDSGNNQTDVDIALAATNGLTLSGNNFKLGGTLTDATTTLTFGTNALNFSAASGGVSVSTMQFDFGGINFSNTDQATDDLNSISISPNGAVLQAESTSSSDFMQLSLGLTGGAKFTDLRATPVGLVYAADYSASFTNRSLVDKEYVDDAIAAASIADADYGDITVSSSGAVWTIDTNISKDWTGTHSYIDNNFSLLDNADNTKIAKFEVSNIATGTTRTFTFPDANGTIPVLSLAQSWTAKQTFTGDGTNAGLNIGSFAGNPGSPSNGDVWYNTSNATFSGRMNGVSRVFPMGTVSGSGGVVTSTSNNVVTSSANFTYDSTNGVVANVSNGNTSTSNTVHTVKAESTGDMADGFGPTINFQIRDTAAVDNSIAEFSVIRSGADNTGQIRLRTASGGSMGNRLSLSPTAFTAATATTVDFSAATSFSISGSNSQLIMSGTSSQVRSQSYRGASTSTQMSLFASSSAATGISASWESGTATASHTLFQESITFNPTSGTGALIMHLVAPTLNTNNGGGTYAGTSIGYDYNPTRTSVTGLTELAMRLAGGQVLFAATSSDTVTANTRIDVRGIASGNILRLAESTNTVVRWNITDNGIVGHSPQTAGNVGVGHSTHGISNTYNMSSGTNESAVLRLSPTINTSGGTNTLRGVYVNPTLTSTTGSTVIAFEATSGEMILSNQTGNGLSIWSGSGTGNLARIAPTFFNVASQFYQFRFSRASGTTGGFRVANGLTTTTATSGSTYDFGLGTSIAPTSGNLVYNALQIDPTYNYTGTVSGAIARGIYYSPTNTSLTGVTHIAIETTSGEIRFAGLANDNAQTRIVTVDSSTGLLRYRDASSIGGGITNSAANNEIAMSDGTNLVGSKLIKQSSSIVSFTNGSLASWGFYGMTGLSGSAGGDIFMQGGTGDTNGDGGTTYILGGTPAGSGKKGNVQINTAGINPQGGAFICTLGNRTADPSAGPADGIFFYAKDSSVGSANSTLALWTEQAVEAIGTFTASHKLRVWINNTEYWIQLDAV